ncbi:alpha 1,2-mannosyltransferase 2.4.1 [Tieghemiomyces parasiticus]|uniref:Alpha 1,2-mannosyltransferase 2.4.1 n=1 Tax=Tieghemiomyces parasiticus TaxID=78921 RepID=A0A9W7ZTE7_9FUNG|nr:alpha 1,2-mannosyltransferase 2.4.1 [Tieghemiomyces parasiticus]
MAVGFLGRLNLRVLLVIILLVVAVHYLITPFVSERFRHATEDEDHARVLVKPEVAASAPPAAAVAAPAYDWSKFSPYDPPPRTERRAKACFVILVRNSDVHDMRVTMRQLEDRFNKDYNYPYVFLNNEPFSDEFKQLTSSMASGNTSYGLIPKEHWGYPPWISQQKAAETREKMKDIIYGSSESYRHMCRYESGFFYRHPLMDQFDYYWRVEPGVDFLCDIRYDPFMLMQERQLKYGFTISLHEYRDTVPTLWKTTREFMDKYPQHVAKHNTLPWVTDQALTDYNMCHFWSNFEIGSVKWLRSEQYTAYFDFLDQSGGFFYERWGDAPVHSLAVAMFLRKEEVHWFEDIGYFHGPFYNCPNPKALNQHCHCNPKDSLHLSGWSCTKAWGELPDTPKV